MYHYRVTPRRNLPSIARHSHLGGSRALVMGHGSLTTGCSNGAAFIHVSENIDHCAGWVQCVPEYSQCSSDWSYMIRFDPQGPRMRARRDPASHTGVILQTDCIPPSSSWCHFGGILSPEKATTTAA